METRRGLDPFALPAETNARFNLLVLAIIGLSVTAGLFIFLTFTESGLDFDPVLSTVPEVSSPTFFVETRAYLGRAVLFFGRYFLAFLLPMTVVFGVAWLVYRRHPHALMRKRRLSVLAPGKWPSFQAEVRQLARTSRVSPPAIASTPTLKGQGAQAFGVRGRPMLRLDGGWRLQQRKDPATFRAVVLHELGHWANGDVGRTYFAQALWQVARWLPIAFLVIAALTFLGAIVRHVAAGTFDLAQVLTVNTPALLSVSAQVGLLFVTIAANRAGLLRVREYYADAFAVQKGSIHALQRQFAHGSAVSLGWRQRLFRLHPTAGERAAAIARPGRLFLVQKDIVFWAGLLFALIGAGMLPILIAIQQVLLGSIFLVENLLAEAVASQSLLVIGLVRLLLIFTFPLIWLVIGLPILLLSFVVVGVVGASLQREAVAGVARSWRFWAILAFVMTIGVELGFLAGIGGLLSPVGILLGQGVALWRILLFVPMAVMLLTGIWFWLFYMRTASKWLIAAHKGDRSPRWTRWLLNGVGAIVLWACWSPALIARILVFAQIPLGDTLVLVLVLSLLAGAVYGGIFAATWGWARFQRWRQRALDGQGWLYFG